MVHDPGASVLLTGVFEPFFTSLLSQPNTSPSAFRSEFSRTSIGFYYLRLLVDGKAAISNLVDEMRKAFATPIPAGILDPDAVEEAMPELALPHNKRLVPVYRGIRRLIDGWKERSDSLSRMGYASWRKLVRLGHESMGDEPVLLLGETGTGKDVAARIVHELSPRSCRPFRPVNCGGLPEDLAHSLLFGHVKGAFTGAVADQAGALVAASGGTVFLDEVGELSPKNQALLLRALGEKRVLPLGANVETPVDVRLVAATNRNLAAMVEKGEFRADLYYRLRGDWAVRLQPLRELSDRDRTAIWDALIAEASKKAGVEVPARVATASDAEVLRKYPWPGNIRQMATFAQKYVEYMTGQPIPSDLSSFFEFVDLSFHPRTPIDPSQWPDRDSLRAAINAASAIGLDEMLAKLEDEVVSICLELDEQNRARTAERFHLDPTVLRARLSRRKKQGPPGSEPSKS